MRDIPIPFADVKYQIQMECSGYFSEFIDTQKVNFIQGISIHDALEMYNFFPQIGL